jgi:hypothetical protein
MDKCAKCPAPAVYGPTPTSNYKPLCYAHMLALLAKLGMVEEDLDDLA